MPRQHHRQRRHVSVRTARFLPVLGFRYSTTRDAYVLRLIGHRIGPVFQVGGPVAVVARATEREPTAP